MNQQNANFLQYIHNVAEQRVLEDIERKLVLKNDYEGLLKLKKLREKNNVSPETAAVPGENP